MATITTTIPDDLARDLAVLDPAALSKVLRMGLAEYRAEQQFREHLRQMQADDIIAASHKAKERSHEIVEDQELDTPKFSYP